MLTTTLARAGVPWEATSAALTPAPGAALKEEEAAACAASIPDMDMELWWEGPARPSDAVDRAVMGSRGDGGTDQQGKKNKQTAQQKQSVHDR